MEKEQIEDYLRNRTRDTSIQIYNWLRKQNFLSEGFSYRELRRDHIHRLELLRGVQNIIEENFSNMKEGE